MIDMHHVNIKGRSIGANYPCFVIAEAGVNHNGRIDWAKRLVDVAMEAGGDAVKFQKFCAEQLVTAEAPKATYQKKGTEPGESQLAMLKRLELKQQEFYLLRDYCRERGILFLSTPFDFESADFLNMLGLPAFKISSGEITNHPFLAH